MAKLKPIELAADIVRSFVSSNSLPRGDVPALITSVHSALRRRSEAGEPAAAVLEPAAPAVSIRKSLTPDYLICLEDGKRFKSLRRHLATLGMTPEQYREKWNLPASYPMVAPNYAAQRSALAKTIGLGQTRAKPIGAPPAIVETGEDFSVEEPSVVAVRVDAAPAASGFAIEAEEPDLANFIAAESESLEPASVPKRKAKATAKGDAAESGPAGNVGRKRGRPRKATV